MEVSTLDTGWSGITNYDSNLFYLMVSIREQAKTFYDYCWRTGKWMVLLFLYVQSTRNFMYELQNKHIRKEIFAPTFTKLHTYIR